MSFISGISTIIIIIMLVNIDNWSGHIMIMSTRTHYQQEHVWCFSPSSGWSGSFFASLWVCTENYSGVLGHHHCNHHYYKIIVLLLLLCYYYCVIIMFMGVYRELLRCLRSSWIITVIIIRVAKSDLNSTEAYFATNN